ncbi:MAG: putative oxidoreductase [Cyanobacteria bacterium RYN_339]|nr:putative oxidoreductase [Cyanobacteria bacterium RYN_339]
MMGTALSRRTFLKRSIGATVGLLAGSLPLVACAGPAYSHAPAGLLLFTPKEWTVLDAAVRRLAPAQPGRPGGGELGTATFADHLFARANPRLKADLSRLLGTFEDYTFLAGRFKPFTMMTPAEQDAYLANWLDSGLGVKRQAGVGLVRLASMLYYMDPGAWPGIRYPGPWVGRIDVGLGLDNQGPMAANPNPNVFRKYPA